MIGVVLQLWWEFMQYCVCIYINISENVHLQVHNLYDM